jgi:hypothetical protein
MHRTASVSLYRNLTNSTTFQQYFLIYFGELKRDVAFAKSATNYYSAKRMGSSSDASGKMREGEEQYSEQT